MKRIFVSLAIVLIFTSIAGANTEYVTVGQYFGAYKQKDLELAIELAVQNDVDALVQMALQGKIFILPAGERVFLMDSTWTMVQIRFKGDSTTFWSVREAIRKPN